ncbi:MAG TPA: hypothetical protein VKH43_10250 [Thermoanaerobaculia bacterium]|nr:hypothetical protein [Thermoanaerobaculia bacterium]
MAAFLSRTVDGVLKRGSRRAALDQYWTTQDAAAFGVTTVGLSPGLPKSDGLDIWVPRLGFVTRVRAADGKVLEDWSGALNAFAALSAMGRVFVTGMTNPGKLYEIFPNQSVGAVTTVATNLGDSPEGIGFDGSRIWTANYGTASGSVSIVTPGAAPPWTVTTVTAGFIRPDGVVYDGANIWIADYSATAISKVSSAGAILQTVSLGSLSTSPAFDGANLWVPGASPSQLSVVRASSGLVLATLTGNGLNGPLQAAFDGQRVLVTNGNSTAVSVWKAADLTPIGSFSTSASGSPQGACSDGLNFWITLSTGQLVRF